MGLLVDGVWRDAWYDTSSTGGQFQRPATQFRSKLSAEGPFKSEAGRYHLYVSWACPWAHRTLIYRKLKGLEDAIGMTAVEPLMLENGWTLAEGADDRERRPLSLAGLRQGGAELYRARDGACAVGPRAEHHRQQRIRRDHPPVRRLAGRARAARCARRRWRQTSTRSTT